MLLPPEIQSYTHLRCCHIWRSIGTHIWFEFGIPKIKPVKTGRRAIEGDLTLHIVSDNWRLLIDGQCPLNSDNVDNDNFKACGPRWFLDKALPEFHNVTREHLALKFAPSIEIHVFPDSTGDEEEISIKTPDGSYWGYEFKRGWRQTS